MELDEVVRARRMVRSYDPNRPLSAELVTRVLELAIRAPSAGFAQGWDFIVLASAQQRALFWASTTDPHAAPDPWLQGMRTAPVLVLCLSDPNRYLDRYAEPDKGWPRRDEGRWPVPYWDVDTGMAALLILLGAVDEGIGACFFGVPPEDQVAVLAAFGAPADRRIVGVISLGHPAPDRRSPSLRRGRRPLGEVVHNGRFGVRWGSEPTAIDLAIDLGA
jgi:nitroreductase